MQNQEKIEKYKSCGNPKYYYLPRFSMNDVIVSQR